MSYATSPADDHETIGPTPARRRVSYRWLLSEREPSEFSSAEGEKVYAELTVSHHRGSYSALINFTVEEVGRSYGSVFKTRPFDAARVYSEPCKRYSEKKLREVAAETLEAVQANRLCLEFFDINNAPGS